MNSTAIAVVVMGLLIAGVVAYVATRPKPEPPPQSGGLGALLRDAAPLLALL